MRKTHCHGDRSLGVSTLPGHCPAYPTGRGRDSDRL